MHLKISVDEAKNGIMFWKKS